MSVHEFRGHARRDCCNTWVTAFLFNPHRLARVLTTLPTLAAALPPPAVEGEESAAYPARFRKTERAVYRLLANTHYPHLRDGLRAIERTLAAGCRFGELLSTFDTELFVSHMSEVRAADHLQARGFTVATVPRAGTPTPDLHVTGRGVDVTVEVFTRREWLQVEYWKTFWRDEIKNADLPLDYVARISTTSSDPLWSPWDLNDELAATGQPVKYALLADFQRGLETTSPVQASYPHAGGRLVTEFELEHVAASSGGPRRWLFGADVPGPSGYSPAGMLRKIVEVSLPAKAARRQAQSSAGVRCLLVDLTRTGFDDDLRHPVHHQEAVNVVSELDPTTLGLDMVVFFRPNTGRLRGQCLAIASFENTWITVAQVSTMFGAPQPNASRRVP